MALSILILCIVSMTSFNQVALSKSSRLPFDSASPLDFGFSQLIDDLVSANDSITNHKVMRVIFAEVENQSKSLDGSDELIMRILRHGMTYDEELDRYYLGVHDIDELYKLMKRYSEAGAPFVEELKHLASRFTSLLDNSISRILYSLQHPRLFTNKNLMEYLMEYMDIQESFLVESQEAITNDCWFVKQSQQYRIHEVYHQLIIFVVKAYAMNIYAINLRREDFRRWDVAKADKREQYGKTIRYLQNTAVSAINTASRDIRSCKLHANQTGQKFIELKWLFNAIVTNEAYLNRGASCWKTCDDYRVTTFFQYTPLPLEELNICYGRIHDCFHQKVDSYCPATRNSSRFDGLLPKIMGKTNCSKKHDISKKIMNGVFTQCDQCICYCDDYYRRDTVRTFSLRAVESDTSKNRVITGIQFVKRNRMIHLRIQEGELKPKGIIEKSTVKWQPVNEFDYESPYTLPEDFFMITYERKFVNLDTLIAPAGQVLTGIKFGAQGSSLVLEIKTHAFNYTTGILGNGSHYMRQKNVIYREEIKMTAPDRPIHMNHSVIDTTEDAYVTFRMTDLEKDAAQTAIPFIDARPVISNPPVPFSGAGIYYSGQIGYGGFIRIESSSLQCYKFKGVA